MRTFLAVIMVAAAPVFAAAAEPFHLQEATIADIQHAIEGHQLTATQLVKLYLQRVKAYNGPAVEEPEGILGPVKPIAHAKGINALSTLNLRPAARREWGFDDRKARSMTDAQDNDPNMPDALEVAAREDAEFARTGKLVGPLHGIVFAIKDQFDTFDERTTSGADAFYANDRPPRDATFVQRLRAAGAIILGKANMGEYASGFRSSFGGMLVNVYDTTRTPGGSSGGSATAVSANLVTCAIGEETGPSIRAPSEYASLAGIAPTQELVSRTGMMNIGINTRIGPIARTVEDAARILTVIAGYDPTDEMTAFAVGRTAGQPYQEFARGGDLRGLRIGVVREYLDRSVYGNAEYENIRLVEAAVAELQRLGATIVDPGAEGLFTAAVRRYRPMLENAAWTRQHPRQFPFAGGKPEGDHVRTLVEMAMDPSRVPGKVTIRDFGMAAAAGESKYGYDLYLAQRGDANIRTLDDLIHKARFYQDGKIPSKQRGLMTANRASELDTAVRLQRRFAVQQIILQTMAEQKLDAFVCPTGLDPARKLGGPNEPNANGIGNYGMFTFLGQQGLPAITVPAGFTREVYDRVADDAPAGGEVRGGGGAGDIRGGGGGEESGTPSHLTGPFPAELPVGIDFMGRPFSEPVLIRIAAVYQQATKLRHPPADFGPVPGEP